MSNNNIEPTKRMQETITPTDDGWERLKDWIAGMGEYEKLEISVQDLATTTKPKKIKIIRKTTDAVTIEM